MQQHQLLQKETDALHGPFLLFNSEEEYIPSQLIAAKSSQTPLIRSNQPLPQDITEIEPRAKRQKKRQD
jgi:hypothetical protein